MWVPPRRRVSNLEPGQTPRRVRYRIGSLDPGNLPPQATYKTRGMAGWLYIRTTTRDTRTRVGHSLRSDSTTHTSHLILPAFHGCSQACAQTSSCSTAAPAPPSGRVWHVWRTHTRHLIRRAAAWRLGGWDSCIPLSTCLQKPASGKMASSTPAVGRAPA